MQHVKWEKASVAGLSMVRLCVERMYALDADVKLQGGGIAVAFSTWFPQLVDGKVALIASAGLIQVCSALKLDPEVIPLTLCLARRHVTHDKIHVFTYRTGCCR